MVRVLQKRARERTEEKEINPTARTGERCSASQYANKCYYLTIYPTPEANKPTFLDTGVNFLP